VADNNAGSVVPMGAIPTLYWSHVEAYEVCPLKGLWKAGWEGIDLGAGPGRPKPQPRDKSRHHAVMGIVVQGVLEDFYNKEEWREPVGLQKRLTDATRGRLAVECGSNFIDWHQSPPYEEMEQVALTGVLGYLRTMKAHQLLGVYARSEVKLLGHLTKWLPIGGKADFIIRRDDTGITILDGKNSLTKMKYVDPDQLKWYALCFALSFQQLPDRLAFVWYRYPHDEATGEQGLDWVTFTKRDLKELAERAQEVRLKQRKLMFDPTPSHAACRFCDFESQCEARQQMKKTNSEKRRKGSLPVIAESSDGIVELGFGAEE
jgi:hypothetical protein